MRKDDRFLFALVAAALALRLFRIGAQSLWIDEIFTINVSTPTGELHIWDYLKYNIHGPLHSFTVYLFHFVSMSDGWLRVPSALAGAAAIVYFYRWMRLWLGERVARIAAVLLVVNPLHVYYSQEVRNYSFLLFFGMLATYYLHRLVIKETYRHLVLYAFAMAASALCNFTAVFLYMVHTLIFLLRRNTSRRRVGRWLVAGLVIGVLVSPWLYRVYLVIDFGRLATPVLPGEIDTSERLRGETTFAAAGIPYAFYAFSSGFSLGPSLRELHDDASVGAVIREHGAIVLWVVLLCGGLALVGVRRLLLGAGPWGQVLLYVAVPFVLTLVLNWQNAKAFNVRYVLFAMPPYVCLIALGIDGLRPRVRSGALVLVVATAVASLGNYYFNGRYAREDIRSAARAIERDAAAEDCILAPAVFEVFEHYFARPNSVRPVFAGRVSRESVERQLAPVFAECDNVWYVRARPWDSDPNRFVAEALEQRYHREQVIEYNGVKVFRYAAGIIHHH